MNAYPAIASFRKVKWKAILTACIAAAMGFLAWVVGRKSPMVLAAQLKAAQAQKDRLETELVQSLIKRTQMKDAEAHAAQAAQDIKKARAKMEELDQRSVAISDYLLRTKVKSDEEFADAFNARYGSNADVRDPH